jgi:hypothetical protein
VKQNLDTLRTEIQDYLKTHGFVVLHGLSRSIDGLPEIDWDTAQYPDYKQFLSVAKELEVRVVVLHHRQFDSAVIERALEEVDDTAMDFDEGRQIESRLRDFRMYDGFTCVIELSFDHEAQTYMFELRTDWFNELNDILEELDMLPDEEEDDTFGGYYSKN